MENLRNDNLKMPKRFRIFYKAMVFGIGVSAFVLICIYFIPYEVIKPVGDLISKDGTLESLTPDVHQRLCQLCRLFGGTFIILTILLIVFRKFISSKIYHLMREFWSKWNRVVVYDNKVFWADFWRAQKSWLTSPLIWASLLLGICLRIFVIAHPLEYDEGYTYIEFARYPLKHILTDYHVPNNHVFHTILVFASTRIFGHGLIGLRIPSMVTGLFLIPALFLMSKYIYNQKVGWITSLITACYPYLVLKSTSARGYSLIALLAVLVFISAFYWVRKKNFIAWIVFILLSSFGMFTIPIFVMPLVFIFIWLAFWGMKDKLLFPSRGNYFRSLIVAGFLIVGITFLLYSGIIIRNGLHRLVSNSFIEPQTLTEFIRITLLKIFRNLINEWGLGLKPSHLILIIIGFILSFVPVQNDKRWISSPQIAFLLSILIILFVRRPDPLARIWIWILPFLIVWANAGWEKIITRTSKTNITRNLILNAGGIIILILFLFYGSKFAYHKYIQKNTLSEIGSKYFEDNTSEQVTLYLKDRITSEDVVVASQCSDAQYWYYFNLFYIPEDTIRRAKSRVFSGVYVIVYPDYHDETINSVLQTNGPDSVFLDFSTLEKIKQIGNAYIYYLQGYREIIEREYKEIQSP